MNDLDCVGKQRCGSAVVRCCGPQDPLHKDSMDSMHSLFAPPPLRPRRRAALLLLDWLDWLCHERTGR